MKILYLAHRIPYPPNKGDKIRSFNEIKYLSSSHEIHLACLADNPADLKHANDLNQYCKKVYVAPLNKTIAKAKSLTSLFHERPLSVAYFYSNSLQTVINQWLSGNSYDAIICFSSPMAEYLFRSPFLAHRFQHPASSDQKQVLNHELSSMPAQWNGSPIPSGSYQLSDQHPASGRSPIPNPRSPMLIMDFCDLDSDKWLQYSQRSRFPLNLVYKVEHKRLFKYEKRINQLFDHSVFVSNQEANLFQSLFPKARNISVIPNGVDYNYFSPEASTQQTFTPLSGSNLLNRGNKLNKLNKPNKPNKPQQNGPILLFTGAMDYHANVEGVTWFCSEILPLIKRNFPKSQFHIVGSNPHHKVRDLANRSGIKVTGFVEDIRPYYQAADVCVIPLRLARGVQNKVLEAMAMGKAVVATSKATEGIQAVPEEHVLIEDTVDGFFNAVLRLFKDHSLRKRLGAMARELVMAKYDWSTNMKKLENFLQAS